MTHFLQSPAWQSFQKNLGRKTFRQSGEGWEYLAVLEQGNRNSRLYCPYGPTAKDQRALEEAIDSLKALGKKYDVTFLRIEPLNPIFEEYLSHQGWYRVTYQSLNPEHTSIISLAPDEDEIVSQMEQPVRNCYRNYYKKDVHITSSVNPLDISLFLDLIHQVADRTGMQPHSDEYFQKQADTLFPIGAARLWYATHRGTVIASSLMYDSGDTRYYAHAAASSLPEYRKLNASTALLAEAIIDAKRHGLTWFDLYGIAPENSPKNHPWTGFTKFKQSFGGHDASYAGSWDLPIKTLPYWAYRIYQTIKK